MRRSVLDPVPSPNGNHLGQVLDRGAVPGQIHASKPTDKAVEPNDYLANRAILHSELPMAAKCILIAIADKARHGRSVCTISYADIAELVRLKRRWTITHVQRLARGRWITIQAVRAREIRRSAKPYPHGTAVPAGGQGTGSAGACRGEEARLRHGLKVVSRGLPLGQVLDRGAVPCTPGMQSPALPGCSPPHSRGAVSCTHKDSYKDSYKDSLTSSSSSTPPPLSRKSDDDDACALLPKTNPGELAEGLAFCDARCPGDVAPGRVPVPAPARHGGQTVGPSATC